MSISPIHVQSRLAGVSVREVTALSLRLSWPERWLLLLFLISLPLINPWIRGDGVGYYAWLRAPLIEHSLDFRHDYISANAGFHELRVDQHGEPLPIFRTATGHLDNHFSIGPAILWSPFVLIAHTGVLIARAFGAHVSADGFSAPYRLAMAFGTAVYGFLGLLLSFRLARHYISEVWTFLATISIWWGSSLPVYMYFNPSWSHTHSAFAVALFLWYWHRTRGARTLGQWCTLGLIAGLMLNVYYANATLLTVLAVEASYQYRVTRRDLVGEISAGQLLARYSLSGGIVLVCLLPTFVTRNIIYGSPFESGYIPLRYWLWRSPPFFSVLFSSQHGLFAWTPLLLLATIGLFLFRWREPKVGKPLLAAALAFYLLICCYPDWAGISSYGNRFFVSLTPLFIMGLGVLLERTAALFRSQRVAVAAASAALGAFILWNAGFMFQWGTHLLPVRGPISWREMARNQFFIVPREMTTHLHQYFFRRNDLMREIEQRDIDQMKKESPP